MTEIHQETKVALTDLQEQAKVILLRHRQVSISLLQRNLKLGYACTVQLMTELEQLGIVTALDAGGRRSLSTAFASPRDEIRFVDEKAAFQQWALEEFSGCDGGDPGSEASPSIWLFGIEHGVVADSVTTQSELPNDENYSVQTQLGYHYNRNGFKLLAAINGEPVENYRDFAERQQPWVRGSKGHFKGNLYPYPCRSAVTWDPAAAQYTGFPDKAAYQQWCNEKRLPIIAEWVERYRPRVFIGVGITCRHEYSKAYYGADVPLVEYRFTANGYLKRIFFANLNGKILIVVPHLSGSSHGLNSDEAIKIAGSFIAGILN